MGTRKIRTPGAERQSALEAATQLMGEREKYEKWLDDLEAKKDSTPAKVFDRVRQDYLSRLQTVMEQLSQHTATLQEHADTLAAKLRDLADAEETSNEEQAEAALRKQVGEITSVEWESGSKKAQRDLAKLQETQAVITEELNRIRELLGGDDDGDDEQPKAAPPSRDFNELEFLSSVVGVATPPPAAPPAATPPAATPPAATPAAARAASVAPRVTPVATPLAATQPPTAAAMPTPAAVAKVPEPPVARETPASTSPAPAAAAPVPPVAPAPPAPPSVTPSTPPQSDAPVKGRLTEASSVLRSSGIVDQPKTLKCTECAAMNYPSEWYCERCGAELTVV